MIERALEETLKEKMKQGKAIIVMGARQVGKTTMLKNLFSHQDRVLWLNGDEAEVRTQLETSSSVRLKTLIGQNEIIIIDEAQRIRDIGIILKLIIDEMPEVQLVATGSSSFDLSNKINEPLTGRKREYCMYPLSFEELCNDHGLINERQLLPNRLVYGSYPDVVTHPGEEKELLQQLSDSYLYKDIFQWERINKPDKIVKLLQALAFQVGSQVSYVELGQMCGLDHKTVEKYIMLLEQSYVIFRLGSFSRNLRNELKSSRKIYFYDNGIRNAVISDFRPIELRDDIGKLWENYLISERTKWREAHGKKGNIWFWRTQQQNEIDYIEEGDGQLRAYELKWSSSAKVKQPRIFLEAYPESTFEVINQDTFEQFLGVGL